MKGLFMAMGNSARGTYSCTFPDAYIWVYMNMHLCVWLVTDVSTCFICVQKDAYRCLWINMEVHR